MAVEPNPPAEIRQHKDAASMITEAKSLSDEVLTRNRKSAEDVQRIGELLIAAKKEVGHGGWQAFLRKQWRGLPIRTAQFWMRAAKRNVAHLAESFGKATHSEKDDGDPRCGDPHAICDACQAIVNSGRSALAGCPECEAFRSGREPVGTARKPRATSPPPPPPPPAVARKPEQGEMDFEAPAREQERVRSQFTQTAGAALGLREQVQWLARSVDEFAALARAEGLIVEAGEELRCPALDALERLARRFTGAT